MEQKIAQLSKGESVITEDTKERISKEHPLQALEDVANILRLECVEMTTSAESGHPTSCASMAEIAAVTFFDKSGMRYDPKDPKNFTSDKFILSKGHCAPILYAAWALVGNFEKKELSGLRKINSVFGGHPGPQLPFVDVASGSLGQGLSVACGMAYCSKYTDNIDNRYVVVMGDGEVAEGQIWEACNFAAFYKLDNIVGFVDVNRMGQTTVNMFDHDVENHRRKFESFGWHTIIIDGHDISEIILAQQWAKENKGAPSVIIAKTFKGKNLTDKYEDKDWHGKALGEHANAAISHLKSIIKNPSVTLMPNIPEKTDQKPQASHSFDITSTDYLKSNLALAKEVSTRTGYGNGLKKLAEQDKLNLIFALDADTKTSTMSNALLNAYPSKFVECYIAEQNMVSVAQGFAARGKIPFCSTFAAFFTRAFDQIRLVGISGSNVKFCGSHSGCSIGPDGPTQMALEDIAMFRTIPKCVVLYPSDPVATEKAVQLAANYVGPVYIRTNRPVSPIIYNANTEFEIGKSKVVRQSKQDKLAIVTSGMTLGEALSAAEELEKENIHIRVVDLFSVKPVDVETLQKAGNESEGRILTLEDHYPEGGIHDAVLSAVAKFRFEVHQIAVNSLPRSGEPHECLDMFNLKAKKIAIYIRSILI